MAIPQGVTIPKSNNNFMKLEDGSNKFRVLGDIRTGWEGWKDNKPFRHEGDKCLISVDEVDLNKSGKPNLNYFWVMPVWNYTTEQVQVLEITQKTIMSSLFNLESEEEWGELKGYDIKINRKKEGDKTSYDTQGIPPKKVSAEILQAFAESEVLDTIEEMFDYDTTFA